MIVYTLEQRWEILRHYFEKHGNVAECVRKLRTNFRRRETPSAPYVRERHGRLRLTEDADFGKKKIIFSYEFHFDLNGAVKKVKL